jgi:hypothetical protein
MSIPYSSIGDPSIQGFATAISVNAGGTEYFKVNAAGVSAWHINIFRMGYYQGLGARQWASNILPSVSLPQTQPTCQVNPGGAVTGLIDCGNWAVSASWQVPSYAVSGLYVALLTRNDTGGVSEVPFVVRNDGGSADIVYQTSDATWEAYNAYNPPGVSNPNGSGIDGGNSLYQCYIACPPGHPGGYQTTPATAVSYNRPLQDGAIDSGRDGPFYAEIPLIQFMEQNGYNVTYISEADTDSTPSALLGHKIFISSAHDEYWSGNMRANVMAARNAGVNLAFFSGNEAFWKTNYAASPVDSTPERTLVSFKETHNEPPYGTAPNQYDPQDPPTWTGTWRDPNGAATGGDSPENVMTGQEFMVNSSGNNDDIQVPYQYAKLFLWKNTAVAQETSSSQPVVLGSNLGSLTNDSPGFGTLGYEWDIDADNGFRPAGEIDMSSTTDTKTSSFVQDYGTNPTSTTANPTTETHHLTLYRAASGALVFGAGTVQWAWGLDNNNPIQNGSGASDKNMQQATVNLFAAMGVQPATLMSGLVAATAPGYGTAPTSTIGSLHAGSTLTDGAPTTITGTATDTGGGVVAGVEISTDGGKTWHPVTSMSPASTSVTWSYSWPDAHGAPSTVIETRATDDAGNTETPSDGVSVTINCPCSIWGPGYTPATPDTGSASPITVGVKFTSDTFGVISGIRFYKSTANTATAQNPHVGQLWTTSGQLLATANFTGESASGWQSVNFSTPVPINPNTTYIASYFAPNGHNAEDDGLLMPNPLTTGAPSAADGPPLHAIRSTVSNPNGVYAVGSNNPTFPNIGDTNPGGDNFGVDITFTPQPAPGPASGVVGTPGNGSVALSWNAPSTGGPVTSYSITPYIGSTAQATITVNGNPAPTTATIPNLTNGKAYTFTVMASNPAGTAAPSAPSAPVTPSTNAPPLFVQAGSAHASSVAAATGLSVQLNSNATTNDRLVVEVGTWATSGSHATSVTDSAGDTFTELAHFTSSDKTELSLWSAPITNGGGSAPKITAKASISSDLGVAVMEYQGLSTAAGTTVLDQSVSATGTTTSAATVRSGATPTTTGSNELALGLYADSGFSDSLQPGAGFTTRANVSPANDIELLAEDQVLATPSAPNASASTGANTTWVMGTVVLKSAAMTPPTAPAAPTNVTATAGDGSATVSWTPPDNGGALISTYTVTPFIGSTAQTPVTLSNSPPISTANVTGLTPGTSYTFQVAATNAVGTGPNSAPSNAVTPTQLTVPDPPTGVTATAGNTTAAVSWTPPVNNGGSAITSYAITPTEQGGEGGISLPAINVSGSTTSTTVTGLENGSTYTFSVQATNAVGQGSPSAQSNAITPATIPSAPTNVTATAGYAAATVGWTAPDSGGSAITSYTILPYLGSIAQTALQVTASGSATSASVTGLTIGSSYTFTVQATNAIGNGPASSQSPAVVPLPPPSPPSSPTGVVATAGVGQVTVSWTAPTGGSAPTSYTVTPYVGGTAQASLQVNGNPPAVTDTITTLTNGTTYTFTVTATNSAGSSAPSSTSAPATPEATAPACPCSIFGTATPATVDSGDTQGVNLGATFTVDQPGYIAGIRFYKAATNTGTHVGTLWSSTGTQLAQVTFSGETASGWQQALFSSPVAVSPGSSYVVSYFDPVGHYSDTAGGLATGAATPPLYATANSTSANGLFAYGSAPTFPTNSYNATNYWVDPIFTTVGIVAPTSPTAVIATAGVGKVTVAWTAPSGGSPPTSYTITPYVGGTAQIPLQVNGNPPATSDAITTLTNGTTYTFTVTATNAAGSSAPSSPLADIYRRPAGVYPGRPLLQGGDQYRHPRRHPVECHRHPAGPGHLHGRDRIGLAASPLLLTGLGLAGLELRRVLPGAQGPLRRHRRRPGHRRGHTAPLRHGQFHQCQRPLRLRQRHRLPDQHLQRHQLLGRPRLRRLLGRPALVTNGRDRHRGSGISHAHMECAERGIDSQQLHHRPLRRRYGPSSNPDQRQPAEHRGHHHHPHQRHYLHVHRDGLQLRRNEYAVQRVRACHPGSRPTELSVHRLRHRRTRHGGLRGPERRQPRNGVHGGPTRLHPWPPVLQGGHQRRHARRYPLERDRYPAGPGHLHRRDRIRLAASRLLLVGRGHTRDHVCGLLLRTQRALLRLARRSGHRCGDPACLRRFQWDHAQRALLLRRRDRLPDQHLQRHQLLGGPDLLHYTMTRNTMTRHTISELTSPRTRHPEGTIDGLC